MVCEKLELERSHVVAGRRCNTMAAGPGVKPTTFSSEGDNVGHKYDM